MVLGAFGGLVIIGVFSFRLGFKDDSNVTTL